MPLIKGEVADVMQNNMIHIMLDRNQLNYELSDVEVELKRRNVDHSKSLGIMKYIFVFCTLAALIAYYKSVKFCSRNNPFRFLISKRKTWD